MHDELPSSLSLIGSMFNNQSFYAAAVCTIFNFSKNAICNNRCPRKRLLQLRKVTSKFAFFSGTPIILQNRKYEITKVNFDIEICWIICSLTYCPVSPTQRDRLRQSWDEKWGCPLWHDHQPGDSCCCWCHSHKVQQQTSVTRI